MKCTHCGTELSEQDTLCSVCGTPAATEAAPVENTEAAVTIESPETGLPAEPQTPGTPGPAAKKGKKPVIIIAAVAALAIAAFGIFQLTAKDPKEVVIEAFKNISPDEQISPSEELFGGSEFGDALLTADYETSLDLQLESCSDPTVNAFSGAGLRLLGKNDITGNKYGYQMGLTFNNMDIVNLDFYIGDSTVKAAIPELMDRVFTVDLGEGLADRMKNSPTLGPYMDYWYIDADEIVTFYNTMVADYAQQTEEGKQPFDMKALMTRYREGCKAQDAFEEALIVEKNGKSKLTMDGKEVTCTSYDVTVKKDDLTSFLLTSSEFFLQDETLRQDFLKQLEAYVRMSQLITGNSFSSTEAPEMMQETYTEARFKVYEMITYLNSALTDIQMTVYVSKDGRLASVDGELMIKDNTIATATEAGAEAETEAATEAETAAEAADTGVHVAFQWNLQGGAYLTQNMNGSITLTDQEDATDQVSIDFNRQGTYDKTTLTDDLSVDFDGGSGSQPVNFMYTTSYSAADGSYHAATEIGNGGLQLIKLSAAGVVDELEKGKSLHLTIDELDLALMNQVTNITLSGEYSFAPLTGSVTAPDGTPTDVLTTTEEEWQFILLEFLSGVVALTEQLE